MAFKHKGGKMGGSGKPSLSMKGDAHDSKGVNSQNSLSIGKRPGGKPIGGKHGGGKKSY